MTQEVKEAAKNINIQLYIIPVRTPDEFQPIDRKIFGPLNRFAARLFRMRYLNDPDAHRGKIKACQDMVKSWESLTLDHIIESFEHFSDKEYWIIKKDDNNDMWIHSREYDKANRLTRAQIRILHTIHNY